MKKNKKPRVSIFLECTSCRKNINNKGVFRYITEKNKKNTESKLELNKYCRYCNTSTLFKEIK